MSARDKDRDLLEFLVDKLCNWNAEFDKSKAPTGNAGPDLTIDGNASMISLLQDLYLSNHKFAQRIEPHTHKKGHIRPSGNI